MASPQTIASKFLNFSSTDGTYPTNGKGDGGNGSLSTASDLRNSAECIIDGFIITTSGATDRIWTIRTAAGATLLAFTVNAGLPVGHTIKLNMRIDSASGFTIATANADLIGTVFYRNVRNTPSTA